jgi:hypothetical protein
MNAHQALGFGARPNPFVLSQLELRDDPDDDRELQDVSGSPVRWLTLLLSVCALLMAVVADVGPGVVATFGVAVIFVGLKLAQAGRKPAKVPDEALAVSGPTRRSRLALASGLLGLASFVVLLTTGMQAPLLAWLAVVAALAAGVVIGKSRNRVTGRGLVTAGLLSGVLHLLLFALDKTTKTAA